MAGYVRCEWCKLRKAKYVTEYKDPMTGEVDTVKECQACAAKMASLAKGFGEISKEGNK